MAVGSSTVVTYSAELSSWPQDGPTVTVTFETGPKVASTPTDQSHAPSVLQPRSPSAPGTTGFRESVDTEAYAQDDRGRATK